MPILARGLNRRHMPRPCRTVDSLEQRSGSTRDGNAASSNRHHGIMKVLVACERSQVVCMAFRAVGCEAYSNDILPCLGGHPEWHIIADAAQVVKGCAAYSLQSGDWLSIDGRWDMIIAHPPCTMLTHASSVPLAKGLHSMDDVRRAASFFMMMLDAPCDMVAVENPAPMRCTGLPRYDQILQPYNFGHPYSKRVCLWLRGLPLLLPTRGYYTEHQQWLRHCSSSQHRRARTFDGIAEAMAIQWGTLQ